MALLNQFKASDVFREMAAAQSLRNEVPFAFSLDDRVVLGVSEDGRGSYSIQVHQSLCYCALVSTPDGAAI